MAAKKYGFIDWNSGDDSILYSGSLADANNLAGGVFIGAGAGTEVYASGGFTGEKDLTLRITPTAAERAELAKGFQMSLKIQKGFVVDDYAPSSGQEQVFAARRAGAGQYIGLQKANAQTLLRARDVLAGLFSGLFRSTDNPTKKDFITVTLSGYGTEVYCYIDEFPSNVISAAIIEESLFTYIDICGINGVDGVNGFVLKDFCISTQPVRMFGKYGMRHIALTGHSFSEDMDYSGTATRSLIVGDVSIKDDGDNQGLARLHRLISRHGWDIPQGKIRNTGIGGVTLDDFISGNANSNVASHLVDTTTNFVTAKLQINMFAINTSSGAKARITNITATDLTLDADIFPLGTEPYQINTGFEGQLDVLFTYVTNPDIVMMQMGTNDASSAIPATWQADYQVHIDRLVTAGTRIIVLINTITKGTNPTTRGEPWQSRVDELNVIHQALVDVNPECYLVDAFTIFGGHDNFLESDINQASPTHPNDTGYQKIINGVWDVIYPLIAAK